MKRASPIKCIYSISCPISGNVVYVGRSKNLKVRVISHTKTDLKVPVSVWINEIKAKGLTPKFDVLEIIGDKDFNMWEPETRWINHFRSRCFVLLNAYHPKLK